MARTGLKAGCLWARTRQPMGILHGGASVVLAETLVSATANLCVDRDKAYCVGQEVNANHLRSASEGYVIGVAKPFHPGRTSQVWGIEIRDEQGRPSVESPQCPEASEAVAD